MTDVIDVLGVGVLATVNLVEPEELGLDDPPPPPQAVTDNPMIINEVICVNFIFANPYS